MLNYDRTAGELVRVCDVSIASPLPAGTTIIATNLGENDIAITLGGESVAATMGTGTLVAAGDQAVMPRGTHTHMAAISASPFALLGVWVGRT